MIAPTCAKISVVELELDLEIYPAIVIQDPPTFWSRIKRCLNKLLTNMLCGVANRSYVSYSTDNMPITDTIPPV